MARDKERLTRFCACESFLANRSQADCLLLLLNRENLSAPRHPQLLAGINEAVAGDNILV